MALADTQRRFAGEYVVASNATPAAVSPPAVSERGETSGE